MRGFKAKPSDRVCCVARFPVYCFQSSETATQPARAMLLQDKSHGRNGSPIDCNLCLTSGQNGERYREIQNRSVHEGVSAKREVEIAEIDVF